MCWFLFAKYSEDRPRRGAEGRTLRASPWSGIVATRALIDREDPYTLAVPSAMIVWLLDTHRNCLPGKGTTGIR